MENNVYNNLDSGKQLEDSNVINVGHVEHVQSKQNAELDGVVVNNIELLVVDDGLAPHYNKSSLDADTSKGSTAMVVGDGPPVLLGLAPRTMMD